MSRYHSYINSAAAIIGQYNGGEPLSSFLKKYYAANKKFGSKDRREVTHLCYCYYRLGKALPDIPVLERMLTGLFLCAEKSNEILAALKPEWNDNAGHSFSKKLQLLQYTALSVFPWSEELSSGVDFESFNQSHFVQPDLYLRLRPGKENKAKEKLLRASIAFKEITSSCLALSNNSKVDTVLELDTEAVVQDFSSQRVAEMLQLIKNDLSDHIKVWDCCAASGGKSILAKDVLGDIDLTVSDIRQSILINLKKRFERARVTGYNSFMADLANSSFTNPPSSYNLIICDAPCTGSGTWGRTPEQLYYFDMEKAELYAALQKKISGNIVPCLEPGGWFLYITCSVFKKENEVAVDTLVQQHQLQLVKQELFKGYYKKADTLFVALLRRQT